MDDKANRKRDALKAIEEDMAADTKNFDGQPFNGRTVATQLGNQAAAIAALAVIVDTLVVETERLLEMINEKQLAE